jgi:hypothetical protein
MLPSIGLHIALLFMLEYRASIVEDDDTWKTICVATLFKKSVRSKAHFLVTGKIKVFTPWRRRPLPPKVKVRGMAMRPLTGTTLWDIPRSNTGVVSN